MENLFAEFAPATYQQWVEEALRSIKASDIHLLDTPTYEGITISPFYTEEHTQALAIPMVPGWENREYVQASTLVDAQARALEAQSQEADGVRLDLTQLPLAPLEALLDTIDHKQLRCSFWLRQDVDRLIATLDNIPAWHGSVDMDFISDAYATHTPIDEAQYDHLAALVRWASHKPNTYTLTIHTQHFAEAGCNAVQEVAFGLAVWAHYLDMLTDRGIAAATVLAQTEFSAGIGGDYFIEIAKFRAWRWLWQSLAAHFDVPDMPMQLHARTGTRNKSPRDAYNNILRTTTEAMSAVIGGANALSIAPYNATFAPEDEFGRRIARNISHILKAEAHLDVVGDIAAGAYYLDALTRALAHKAWALFQEMEQQGGFVALFAKGWVQREIEKIAAQRESDFAAGKRVLVGVNKYQNPKDQN